MRIQAVEAQVGITKKELSILRTSWIDPTRTQPGK